MISKPPPTSPLLLSEALRRKRAEHPRCEACGKFLRVWEEVYGDPNLGIPEAREVVVGRHVGYDYWNGGYEFSC